MDINMAQWPQGWRDCYTSYRAHLWERSHSENTLLNYIGVLARFFTIAGGGKSPVLYTRAEVEAFSRLPSERTKGGPVAARTRNNRLTVISSFYAYACGFEYIDGFGHPQPLTERNPAMGIRQSRVSKIHRTMQQEEWERFIAAIPRDGEVIHARDRAMFLALWWTCRRREELCSLLWGNLHRTAFIDPKTQARRDGWTYTFRNKGGEIYSAEMPAPAMDAILDYLRLSERLETIEADDPIFAAIGLFAEEAKNNYTSALSGQGLWFRMRYYLRLAGMDERAYSPHSLRHSGALARYHAGSGPLEIMHVLNHKSLQTTTVYVKELDVSQDTGALLLLEKYGSL